MDKRWQNQSQTASTNKIMGYRQRRFGLVLRKWTTKGKIPKPQKGKLNSCFVGGKWYQALTTN